MSLDLGDDNHEPLSQKAYFLCVLGEARLGGTNVSSFSPKHGIFHVHCELVASPHVEQYNAHPFIESSYQGVCEILLFFLM